MSRAHRTIIRTFGNGHQRSPRFILTTDMDGYLVDHASEPFVAEALSNNGRTFSRGSRPRFILDLGGMVLMDQDKQMRVRAAGYWFTMWEHQVAEYLHRLEGMQTASDNPDLMILGGRWTRTVVCVKTATALRDALRPMRDEIVRKIQKRDQEMAARLEQVGKVLDAKGVTMRLEPSVEAQP